MSCPSPMKHIIIRDKLNVSLETEGFKSLISRSEANSELAVSVSHDKRGGVYKLRYDELIGLYTAVRRTLNLIESKLDEGDKKIW